MCLCIRVDCLTLLFLCSEPPTRPTDETNDTNETKKTMWFGNRSVFCIYEFHIHKSTERNFIVLIWFHRLSLLERKRVCVWLWQPPNYSQSARVYLLSHCTVQTIIHSSNSTRHTHTPTYNVYKGRRRFCHMRCRVWGHNKHCKKFNGFFFCCRSVVCSICVCENSVKSCVYCSEVTQVDCNLQRKHTISLLMVCVPPTNYFSRKIYAITCVVIQRDILKTPSM